MVAPPKSPPLGAGVVLVLVPGFPNRPPVGAAGAVDVVVFELLVPRPPKRPPPVVPVLPAGAAGVVLPKRPPLGWVVDVLVPPNKLPPVLEAPC